MVTYGDYFSRKVLHQCGVSPEKTLFNKEENGYTGVKRTENIHKTMGDIYQTLYSGYMQKNTSGKDSFADFKIERKIVSAFYDSGVLDNAERDYFHAQTLRGETEREKISVEEANLSAGQSIAPKVEAPVKTPLVRKI